jgi:hypothetical protein
MSACAVWISISSRRAVNGNIREPKRPVSEVVRAATRDGDG